MKAPRPPPPLPPNNVARKLVSILFTPAPGNIEKRTGGKRGRLQTTFATRCSIFVINLF